MLQQHRMSQLLLAVVLITVCKAQYGDIAPIAAPPAPAPARNYDSNILEEIPYTNEASNPQNEYANPVKQVIHSEDLSSPTQLSHAPEHVACIYSVNSTVTQSTTIYETRQPSNSILPSTSSSSRTSRFTSTRSRPRSLTTRSSSIKTTRQTTTRRPVQSSITTQRTTSSSRRSTSSRSTQATIRTTRNQTDRRSTAVITQVNNTRRPEDQTIRFDCTLISYDTLFVVDSTSSIQHFFDDHRNYITEIITMIIPEFDNEAMIGIIEYSSPSRRQVKLPFKTHKNRSEIIGAIKKLPFFAGVTATGAALELTLETLRDRRSNVLTNVVVLTDGFSYDSVNEPSLMLHRLPNVRTFTATVTNSWRQYELEIIAGDETRVFKGKDSARNLAKALTSCDNNRSRLRNSRGNKLFQ